MTMSVGEKAILHITSDYGYGRQGAGGVIPPNADLVGAALGAFSTSLKANSLRLYSFYHLGAFYPLRLTALRSYPHILFLPRQDFEVELLGING